MLTRRGVTSIGNMPFYDGDLCDEDGTKHLTVRLARFPSTFSSQGLKLSLYSKASVNFLSGSILHILLIIFSYP